LAAPQAAPRPQAPELPDVRRPYGRIYAAARAKPAPPFWRRRKRRLGRRYDLGAMIHPRIDELIENVDSRYALVIVAAKRARQINNYHHQLGEGTFDQFLPPLIESRSKNYLTMALEEIAEGKIKYSYTK
jgi:DNA-directed RNA polymerase subunit omega